MRLARAALTCLLLATPSLWATESPSAATWRQAIGAAILGAPVAQAQSVAAVCDDRSLRAYSQTGRELWRYYPRENLLPFLTRSPEGTNIIADIEGNLIAVNRSGREIWKSPLGAKLWAPALIGLDGRIFAATAAELSCFTGSGFLLWKRKLQAMPALELKPDGDGGLIMALEDDSILTASAFGTIIIQKLPAKIAAIAPAPSHAIAVAFRDGRLTIYPEGGASLASLGSRPIDIAVRNNFLATLLSDGSVNLFDLTKAQRIWTGQAPSSQEARLYLDERGVYSLGKSGSAGFSWDGRRLWNIRLAGSGAIPAFSDDGILYSGGDDWILYAYRVEDRIRSSSGQVELRGYGMPEHSPWADEPFVHEESTLDAHLAEIEGAIARHDLGTNEHDYIAWLMETAGACRSPAERTQTVPQVLPDYRVRATDLIGLIGSREEIGFLVDLFRHDSEPLVKSAAAEAIGRIGVDPGGKALDAFSEAALRQNQDERFLASIVGATASLCRFSGPPLSDRGIRLLSSIIATAQSSNIRSRAQSEIESFRIPSPGNRL